MFKHIFLIMLLGLALSIPVQAARPGTYGPVGSQDTLWTIASRLKPKGAVTVQQTMLAIYHKNPAAFTENNINSLMKGVTLKVPGYAEVRRYSRLAALRETRKHNRYWKRGIKLPKSSPPPVPRISEPAQKKVLQKPQPKPVAKKPVAPAPIPAAANKPSGTPAVPAELTAKLLDLQKVRDQQQQEIQDLRSQLQAAEAKNKQLNSELQTLQAVQAKSGSTPEIEQQVSKLKAELNSLTTVLEQKDNHIKMLQASLKSASEAIKSQHADNLRLADKLRELNPATLPAVAAASGKPELKLASVQEGDAVTPAAGDASATPAAATGETTDKPADPADPSAATSDSGTGTVWADQGKPVNSTATPVNAVSGQSIPLTEMLGNSASKRNAADTPAEGRSVSPLAIAIALISFLFILALIWRAFVQQRELKRIEAEEKQVAEKMRRRLEDNQSAKSRPAEDDKPLSAPELHF